MNERTARGERGRGIREGERRRERCVLWEIASEALTLCGNVPHREKGSRLSLGHHQPRADAPSAARVVESQASAARTMDVGRCSCVGPERWWVDPPSTFEAADQATRSVASALPSGRVLVECAVPGSIRAMRTSSRRSSSHLYTTSPRRCLRARLPKSKDHIKLLFNSMGEATIAGASIMTTSLPVSVLGHPSAIGPRDGAFIVVAPTCSSGGLDRSGAARPDRGGWRAASDTREPTHGQQPSLGSLVNRLPDAHALICVYA